MATLLSPSPSWRSGGSGSGRRLSEILEEQQEPFSLDLFLLDKGCSPALILDAAASAASCWPSTTSSAAALRGRHRRPTATRATGMLGVILSKILLRRGKRRQQVADAAIDWSRSSPSNSSRRRLVDGAVEVDMEEDEEEEEESKQPSPVSVLEQSPFEPVPSPAYSKKAIVIFKELLAAAYTPALPPDHPTTPTSSPSPSPATSTGRPTSSVSSHWEEEKFEAELAKVHGLIAAEMASGVGWSWTGVCDERRHVGAKVAAAVLEALTEEAAAEMMMLTWRNGRPRCDEDDDDDARCGWC